METASVNPRIDIFCFTRCFWFVLVVAPLHLVAVAL